MRVIVLSMVVLVIALSASGNDAHDRQAVESGPISIDVVYANEGNLHFYSLTSADYQSQFTLHYYEYLRRPQPGEARTQFLVFNLTGSVGRQLTRAFVGLRLSWNPRDYEWRDLPEHFGALPEDHAPCGLVAFGKEQLLACPVSGWASAKQSAQANNLAWFIQLLDSTRYRSDDRKNLALRDESRDALLGLLQRIPSGREVEVVQRGAAVGHQIPVGSMLRGVVAEALVHGGLLDAPMAHPESEIRQAAVEWNRDRLPREDARRVLLHALNDGDSRIRAAAATALAADVAQNDSATIEALRGVLQREPDPFVRQVIQELLDGATIPSRDEQRTGS